ncbi:hypothetical protein B0H13DRAFT_1934185 [Mycena leptocephala]|nr:hypothetical protein B0H13DRAFT_1934185 [Mycena leptocephala]
MDESSDSSDAELIHDMPELHNSYDPGSDDDEEIDIHEENDIPHPKDHADLVHWLKLSDEHLASLHTSSAPLQRGSYHSTKIGKNLSVRRTQELRKAEKERTEREKKEDKRHGLKTSNLHHFFSLPRPIAREPEPETSETPEPEVKDRLLAMDDMDIDPSVEFSDEEPVQDPVQVVVDKTLNTADSVATRTRTMPTCLLSLWAQSEAMAEEGLDELPWDPSEDISPRAVDSPAPIASPSLLPPPNLGPTRSLPPGAASYASGAQGFTMPNRPQRWKMPSEVPSNNSVDAAILNLQNILHPRRGTGRDIEKRTWMRDDCTSRVHGPLPSFVQGIRILGWTLHSETVSTASGKSGSKTWLGRKIREWTISFCEDKKNLPSHKYGRFNSSILSDEDIAGDIFLHLQSLGKFVSAKDIVRYVATPEFQARLRIKRKISLRTAQRWMKKWDIVGNGSRRECILMGTREKMLCITGRMCSFLGGGILSPDRAGTRTSDR